MSKSLTTEQIRAVMSAHHELTRKRRPRFAIVAGLVVFACAALLLLALFL